MKQLLKCMAQDMSKLTSKDCQILNDSSECTVLTVVINVQQEISVDTHRQL